MGLWKCFHNEAILQRALMRNWVNCLEGAGPLTGISHRVHSTDAGCILWKSNSIGAHCAAGLHNNLLYYH